MTATHDPVPELDVFFASDGGLLHREFLGPLECLGVRYRADSLAGLLRHQVTNGLVLALALEADTVSRL